mmetsp:Transcript_3625/g.11150  ORF Transcript_3625/g.11150 Transcript_3625/m.11150 type:complete len:846 (+) Transcript_3625:1560-4097(+)
MAVTGVVDVDVAARHVAAAARLGESPEEAIRKFFELGERSLAALLRELGVPEDLAHEAAAHFTTLDEAADWCREQWLERERNERRAQWDRENAEREARWQREKEARERDAREREERQRREELERRQREQAHKERRQREIQEERERLEREQQKQPKKPTFWSQLQEEAKQQQPPLSKNHLDGAALFGVSPRAANSAFSTATVPPPPPPKKPTLLTDSDFGLFLAPHSKDRPPEEKKTSPPPVKKVTPPKLLADSNDDSPMAPCVVATNPYGHPSQHFLSMPPSGAAGGAEAAATARSAAAKVSLSGKLWKLSGVSSGKASRLGQRWQARHFVLSHSAVGYGDLSSEGGLKASSAAAASFATLSADELTGTKKRFSLYGSYVLPEPPERAQGREFAFAVYRSDADAFSHASSSSKGGASYTVVSGNDERDQLMLLAAEDDKQKSRWFCALLRAAGRGGVLVRVGQDNTAFRLRCFFGDQPLEADIGSCDVANTKKVLVKRVDDTHSGLGAVGVKVGDELVSVNGQHVPNLSSFAVGRMLESCARPLDLEFRRCSDVLQYREAQMAAAFAYAQDDQEDLRKRMQESMDVGAALRADKLAQDALRLKKAEEAQVEAQDVRKAIAQSVALSKEEVARGGENLLLLSHKEKMLPRDDEKRGDESSSSRSSSSGAIETTIQEVRIAADAAAQADEYFYGDHPNFPLAARSYKTALDALLRVKDDLADPQGPARVAVSRRLPHVNLADLFDHINANGALAAHNAEHGVLTHTSSSSSEPPPPHEEEAVALYAYEAQDDWQLSLSPGDRLLVLGQHDDGWADVVFVHDTSTRGLVPSSYIQLGAAAAGDYASSS